MTTDEAVKLAREVMNQPYSHPYSTVYVLARDLLALQEENERLRGGNPPFNHTRGDGPFNPCSECLPKMSREALISLANDREESIRTLLGNIDELTKAVNNAPEFLEAVKVASTKEGFALDRANADNDRLRSALKEALDMLTSPLWSPATTIETATRVAELRKEFGL